MNELYAKIIPSDEIQEKIQSKEIANDIFKQQIKCETCLYADHCDGWEFAPFCMLDDMK